MAGRPLSPTELDVARQIAKGALPGQIRVDGATQVEVAEMILKPKVQAMAAKLGIAVDGVASFDGVDMAQEMLEAEAAMNVVTLVGVRDGSVVAADKIRAVDTMFKYTKRMVTPTAQGGGVDVNALVQALTGGKGAKKVAVVVETAADVAKGEE